MTKTAPLGTIRWDWGVGADARSLVTDFVPIYDVLGGRTLEKQGESLRGWMVETFRAHSITDWIAGQVSR